MNRAPANFSKPMKQETTENGINDGESINLQFRGNEGEKENNNNDVKSDVKNDVTNDVMNNMVSENIIPS